MILAAGTRRRMLGSASRPSITGIDRSSSTTSGSLQAHRLDAGQAVAGLADDLHAAAGQREAEQLAQVVGVVDDHHAHRSGARRGCVHRGFLSESTMGA